MPISFILIGVYIIYLIFYKQQLKYKNILVVLLSLILLGYFVPCVDILNGALFNFFIFVPTFLLDIFFIVKLEKVEGIIFLSALCISVTIYIVMVLNNMEFSTLFSSVYIFLITLFIAVILSFNLFLSLSFSISSFIMYDILNIVLIKNSTGVVTIMSVSSISLIVYAILITIVTNKLFNYLKNKRKAKEKEINV